MNVLAPQSVDVAWLERQTRQIGLDLFASAGRGPAPWRRGWWDERFMSATMDDPSTRVQLFRFIDALPVLDRPADVRRHLTEYLGEADGHVPHLVQWPLRLLPDGPHGDRWLATTARAAAARMAGRFIAGSTIPEALDSIKRLRRRGLGFTADLLGEAVITDHEAERYQHACLEMLAGLAAGLDSVPVDPLIDRGPFGPVSRVNLSLKLSSLVPRFDALHDAHTRAQVAERLRPILLRARGLGAFVNVDMEQYATRDLARSIFCELLMEPDLRDWSDVGIVVQAYLRDAQADLQRLLEWTLKRQTPISVRLVKGAYWDYEDLHARQLGWPVPVFQHKWQTDASFEQATQFLVEHATWLRPAIASHNLRSIAHGLACAQTAGLAPRTIEFQTLYGMGESIENALAQRGQRVRVYTPCGQLLPGMAYLVRRLLENTSNESFLRTSAGHQSPSQLLLNPREIGAMNAATRAPRGRPTAAAVPPPFENEPPTDFSRESNRQVMRAALAEVAGRLGRFEPLHAPHALAPAAQPDPDPACHIISRDPGHVDRIIASMPRAGVDDALAALARAREAFAAWSTTPPGDRAAILQKAAEIMRRRRFELAAWQVYECAKPWREADADVAEAIDFCRFYARQMVELAGGSRYDVPGETNRLDYLPRGVCVVIAPWNFPLAIPCGMTTAALVAGNTVVLKPAEQSIKSAHLLVEILREAGLPPGVLQFLPAVGEEVGPTLVDHNDVDLVAFTGSRAVGLQIHARAAHTPPDQDHVKYVIAEMGGKNAIIVDDDADQDEAVTGVLASAFGYAGQKCSACSRVVVLESIHDAFLARLVEAARCLVVGQAEDPATVVNPVIDAEARTRLQRAIERARGEGRVVLEMDPGEQAKQGHFVGPVIVADLDPHAHTAQDELFGPVLAVLRARDLDHALQIARDVPYALTAGIYSRSPAHIDRVRQELRVGNLYINRPITGALVARQPFGGFKLSGIGMKAGGDDYLKAFLLARVVTENTIRRGFAPEADIDSTPGD